MPTYLVRPPHQEVREHGDPRDGAQEVFSKFEPLKFTSSVLDIIFSVTSSNALHLSIKCLLLCPNGVIGKKKEPELTE